jgi:hypothetical protein
MKKSSCLCLYCTARIRIDYKRGITLIIHRRLCKMKTPNLLSVEDIEKEENDFEGMEEVYRKIAG